MTFVIVPKFANHNIFAIDFWLKILFHLDYMFKRKKNIKHLYLSETKPHSQAVEPKLSNSDELKRSLLMMRLPSVAPAHTVTVKLGIVVSHVTFDARSTKLTSYLGVVMVREENKSI